MNEFSVKTQIIGTVALVDVMGFLEATANKVLADSLEQLQRQGFLRYVIDFSACQVMSSPGIHDLIQFPLRLSDTPIASDLIPRGTAALILSMEPLESLRYLEYLAQDGSAGEAPH